MFLFAFIIATVLSTTFGCQRIVCYYTNWGQYRPNPYKFFPENIDSSLCTHINYAFAKLNGNQLAQYEYNDNPTWGSAGMYDRTVSHIRRNNPDVKILLSVGGWTMSSYPFTQMVATAANREEFADTSVTYLRDRGFDGLDIDWEYPANRGSPSSDKQKYVELVKDVYRVFEEEANVTGNARLLLTAAVAAGKSTIDSGYNVPEIVKYMDFINIMTYDLHGSWDTSTGHTSPLYARSDETGWQAYLNIDWVVRYWVSLGLPKDKLVIGVSTYGRSFTLASANENGLGARTVGPGQAGTYTREGGFISYYEVCSMIQRGARVSRNSEQRVPFAALGRQWVGYDDEYSFREKAQYVLDNDYGGVMIWAYDLDDFNNRTCGEGNFPLIRAIVDQCRGNPTGVTFPTGDTQDPGVTSDPLAQTTRTPVVESGFSCDNRLNGMYSSPYNCSDFYECYGGITYRKTCAGGLVFNPDGYCDWPDNYACNIKQEGDTTTSSTTTTTATTTTTTETPTTTQSTTVTTTQSTTVTPKTTTQTTSATSTTSTTEHPTTTTATTTQTTKAETTSFTTTSTPTTTTAVVTTTTETGTTIGSQITGAKLDCLTKSPGLYSSPHNCRDYLWCAGGMSYTRSCPSGLVFNPQHNYCDWPVNYNCTIPETTTSTTSTTTTTPSALMFDADSYCVNKLNGAYRDPRDCSSFFVCLWKVAFVMQCAPGTVFDPAVNYCNYPFRVHGCY